MEVDSKTKQTFTRSHRTASLSEHNKSRYSREPCDRPQDEDNGDWQRARPSHRVDHLVRSHP